MFKTIPKKAFPAIITLLVLSVLTLSALANQETERIITGEKITIRVDGLSCPFCAYGLEKKLKSIKGVKKIEIKVNDALAILYLNEGAEIAESLLRKKVKEAGFTPREISEGENVMGITPSGKEITLKISGMSCQDCVQKVESALNKVGCARDVQVSLEKNQAVLFCTGDETHQQRLLEAVKEAGFDAEIVEKENK